jgi:hypothetical protein
MSGKHAFPVVFRLTLSFCVTNVLHPTRVAFFKIKPAERPKTKIDTVRYTTLSDTGSICVYSTALHYDTLIRLVQQ